MTGTSVAPEPEASAASIALCWAASNDDVCRLPKPCPKHDLPQGEAASDAPPTPTSALSVLDAVAHVEALAQMLYDDAMGRDWPMPYSSLTVSDQERWRGAAYCATYALAICPITRSVHPWLRSWCEPSCRIAASAQAEASEQGESRG